MGARIVAIALLLAGCAPPVYWVRGNLPTSARPPLVLDSGGLNCPGATDLGCYYPSINTIVIRPGLSSGLYDCVLKHEMKHWKGWTHPLGVPLTYDCGDGTYYVTID